jgi:hypothetical protein
MSSNSGIRRPLLDDMRNSDSCFEDSGEPRLSTLADHLGIAEVDAFYDISSSGSASGRTLIKNRESPTVILTQEQVDTLIETLENTRNTLKQLTYRGDEHRPPRRYISSSTTSPSCFNII